MTLMVDALSQACLCVDVWIGKAGKLARVFVVGTISHRVRLSGDLQPAGRYMSGCIDARNTVIGYSPQLKTPCPLSSTGPHPVKSAVISKTVRHVGWGRRPISVRLSDTQELCKSDLQRAYHSHQGMSIDRLRRGASQRLSEMMGT